MSEYSRVNEALYHLKEAEKAATKGWFRKPDWEMAAQYFEKAGASFRTAQQYESAAKAFTDASDAYNKSNSLFLAAKAMESAGSMYQQQRHNGDESRCAHCFRQASNLYQAHGSSDRAAEILEKAGNILEPVDPDAGIQFYKDACDLYDSEDRGRFGIETFQKTASVLLKHKRPMEAVAVLQRLIDITKDLRNKSTQYRICLSIVIIFISMDDEVEASKRLDSFSSVHGFIGSDEYLCAIQLLEGIEKFDAEGIQQAVHSHIVNNLNSEVIRLARRVASRFTDTESDNRHNNHSNTGLSAPSNAVPYRTNNTTSNYNSSDFSTPRTLVDVDDHIPSHITNPGHHANRSERYEEDDDDDDNGLC
ncbi:hypothetical protein BDF22DRAFT_669718 [Syncephalis plumigaleata]|nr:hypothetical protein BDF22DRAFT_669718 [Syncephalis plumigaleata]